LASFSHTIRDLPSAVNDRIIDFPEVGYDPELFQEAERADSHPEKTILIAGRMVPYKLPDVTVEAFARSPKLQKHRLAVVGDGPLKEGMEERIRAAGVSDRVTFTGRVSQKEVGEWMRKADILSFPTIRELGAGALVEAMACGMACVVVDYGAPAVLIEDDRGVKVPLGDKEAITVAVQRELESLVDDGDRIRKLGANAKEHVERYYSWHAKAKVTLRAYEFAMGVGQKPNFWTNGGVA